jgi:hypothetical protein
MRIEYFTMLFSHNSLGLTLLLFLIRVKMFLYIYEKTQLVKKIAIINEIRIPLNHVVLTYIIRLEFYCLGLI